MNSRPISFSLSWHAYKARPLPIPAFRFFNDLRLSEPFPSAVLLMGFLRIANSDARSSFSRQHLGRVWPVAKWLLAAVAIWLLTAGQPSATEIYFHKLLTTAAVVLTMCLITRWG